MYLKESDTDLL